jgi:hypothetical protein
MSLSVQSACLWLLLYDCPKDSLFVLLGLIKTFVCEMFPSCVQSLLEQNMLLNEAAISAGGGSVQCCELTWGVTSVTSLAQGWATPDLVVAADVVYHRELFDPLLSSLSSLGKTACLLCTQLYALYTCLRMRSKASVLCNQVCVVNVLSFVCTLEQSRKVIMLCNHVCMSMSNHARCYRLCRVLPF